MNDEQGSRPLWVRVVIRPGLNRRGALLLGARAVLVASITLLLVAIESGSVTLLGRIAVNIGLVVSGLSLGLAIWIRLAAGWIDRNGRWY